MSGKFEKDIERDDIERDGIEEDNVKEDIVRVVYFKTDKKPEIGEMVNTVEGMRKSIGGGYAQVINIGIDGMVILCDDEGLIKSLPYNRGLRGDWLIVGSKEGEFISLTKQQAEWIKKNVKRVDT